MNTFESALMARLGADLGDNTIVVNTCAVTGEAERQCRQTIRRLRRENPTAQIVVVGCAVQLNPALYASMPEVDRVLGNHEKLNPQLLHEKSKCVVGPIDAPFQLPIVHEFEGRNKAFLQIQQGCDHHCTFCVVRLSRGPNKGLPPDQVVEQAKAFVRAGFLEIVLTGADVVSYPYGFVAISERLLKEVPEIKRLRFGSLDPAGLKEDFIELVKNYPQVMPHFHFSIQSGDDDILRKMARRHLHVFPYSERPETPAIKMMQVEKSIRKERAKQLRALGQRLYQDLLQKTLGQEVSVLVESDQAGWTENYLHVLLKQPYHAGEVVKVKISGVKENELVE